MMISPIIFLLIPIILSFSPPLALKLNEMSVIAYDDANKIKNWSCALCDNDNKMKDVQVFQSSDKSIQGFTGYY